VLQAEDGAAACDVVRKLGGALDLVVTDIRMPRMTGTEPANLLRSEYPDVKAILMSAFADSIPLASWDFVPKPFTPAMLLLIAERLMRQSDRQMKELPARSAPEWKVRHAW
jgi:two-component system cell cycle sensor histidine kinase/response regulator CckA